MYNFFTLTCGNYVKFMFVSSGKKSVKTSTEKFDYSFIASYVGKFLMFCYSISDLFPLVLHKENSHSSTVNLWLYPLSTTPTITIKRKVN